MLFRFAMMRSYDHGSHTLEFSQGPPLPLPSFVKVTKNPHNDPHAQFHPDWNDGLTFYFEYTRGKELCRRGIRLRIGNPKENVVHTMNCMEMSRMDALGTLPQDIDVDIKIHGKSASDYDLDAVNLAKHLTRLAGEEWSRLSKEEKNKRFAEAFEQVITK